MKKKKVKAKMKKKKINLRVLLFSFIIVFLVAFIGSQFTDTGPWYDSVRPSITPPDIVFPIVWNILFIMIALSLYFAWTESKKKKKCKIAWIYGINFTLNILWSLIFFTLKQPIFAFIELILLWLSILAMILVTKKIKTAMWLLVPYLAWVSFAGILNFLIAF